MRKVALLTMAVILAALLAGCAKEEEVDQTPPVISEVSASDITQTSAIITWTTDEPATSQVEYGLTTSYGSTATSLLDALVTSHSVSLSGLDPDTNYHYRVKSEDASGNEATSSDYTFTTSPDTTPPIISAVGVSAITSSTASVTWTTDEPATSQVEYGLTTSYGSTATSPLDALVTSHSVSLSGLTSETTYHYRVKSEDESGNEAVSADYTFTTRKIFPDDNLEAAIRQAIGKPEGAIHIPDLAGLTSLDASGRNITDVTGVEYCTNLRVLRLSFNQIISITPLANLTSLTNLDLYGNQIGNISPVANLTSLGILNLGRNQISNISPLANLTSLIELYLWTNQISDLSPLADLTSLTILGLYGNQISDISALANMTSLRWLYLDGNQISDITPLANLTSLTELNLGGNQISDISALANMTSLTVLYLWDNQISDITALTNLGSLTNLNLNGNQISNISPITNLTSLTTLELFGNQISDIALLTNLTSLTKLELGANQISDISPLSWLTSLTSLYLSGNQISDITPLVENEGLSSGDTVDLQDNPLSAESSCTLIPQLEARGVEVLHEEPKVVTFPDANLDAAIREAIGKPEGDIDVCDLEGLTLLSASERDIADITGLEYCTDLIWLYLLKNQISDITPLANLTSLYVLHLHGNQISDVLPLSGLTSLTFLALGYNQISDVSPLSGLTTLTRLELHHNQISDITPLEHLTSLTTLYLETNQISDISPLQYLTSLTALYLWGNQISDITPLVNNPGLGDGDTVDLRGNPLSAESLNTLIPQLEARGVTVLYDAP